MRAPEDSAPGRSRQRPDDLDPFPRWVPLAPLPFPLLPFQSLGSVLFSTGIATEPIRSRNTSLRPSIGGGHTGGKIAAFSPF